MYKSFQTLYTQLQEYSGDDTGSSTSGQLRRFQEQINQTQGIVCAQKGGRWKFLEGTATETTVASQQGYLLPANSRKLLSVRVTVSSTDYLPLPVESAEVWDAIESLNLGNSDVAQFYYVRGNQVLLAPTPASASSTITYWFRKRIKELSQDDYSTGNVAAATNAGQTITGTGTTWTSAMVGRFIRIRGTNGDNQWYEITARSSNTSITVGREYQGSTFSAATDAYVIGEMPLLPPDYHDLLLWRPLGIYYMLHENPTMANHYWKMYDGGYEAGLSAEVRGLLGIMLEEEREGTEGAYVASRKDLLDRIRTLDVNTPPSTIITFSDL